MYFLFSRLYLATQCHREFSQWNRVIYKLRITQRGGLSLDVMSNNLVIDRSREICIHYGKSVGETTMIRGVYYGG